MVYFAIYLVHLFGCARAPFPPVGSLRLWLPRHIVRILFLSAVDWSRSLEQPTSGGPRFRTVRLKLERALS